MPPRRWRMGRREQLTPALRRVLEVGRHAARKELHAGELFFTTERAIEGLWRDHGAEVLGQWISAHPGSRPWGWWQWAAPEPRRVTVGVELLSQHANEFWRASLGVPAFVQCRPRGYTALPQVESQASYLLRLGLLARGERSRIRAATFAPEAVDPFLTYVGELEELRAQGERRREAERIGAMAGNGHRATGGTS